MHCKSQILFWKYFIISHLANCCRTDPT